MDLSWYWDFHPSELNYKAYIITRNVLHHVFYLDLLKATLADVENSRLRLMYPVSQLCIVLWNYEKLVRDCMSFFQSTGLLNSFDSFTADRPRNALRRTNSHEEIALDAR